MNSIFLIVKKEYLQRVEKRSFVIMTLLVPILFIVSCTIPALLMSREESKKTPVDETNHVQNLLIVDKSGLYEDLFKSDTSALLLYTADVQKEDSAYSNGTLVIHRKVKLGQSADITLYIAQDGGFSAATQQAYQLLDNHIREQEIASTAVPELREKINYIMQPLRFKITKPVAEITKSAAENNPAPEAKNTTSAASRLAGIITTLLIYMFLLTYGVQVMTCVAQEKMNRIVEVIASSIKPFDLMMGKIIGIGLVGLTQFCIWIGFMILLRTFLPIVEIPHQEQFLTEFQKILAELPLCTLLVSFLLFFIGGYLLYASFFAAIGAVMDHESNDAQQLVMPISLILIFAIYVALYGASSPDSSLVFWTSLFPLTSPVVMMSRIPHGVPLWQLALSIALLYGTFVISTRLAARVYRVGILMYGKKTTLREMIKWMNYKL